MNNDTIVVELDKQRTMKFRRKELKILEKTFNKNISKIEFENFSVDDFSKIIHIGLIHEDSELTLVQLEELIDNYPFFGVLIEKVMEAFTISMAGPQETKKNVNDQTEDNKTVKN